LEIHEFLRIRKNNILQFVKNRDFPEFSNFIKFAFSICDWIHLQDGKPSPGEVSNAGNVAEGIRVTSRQSGRPTRRWPDDITDWCGCIKTV